MLRVVIVFGVGLVAAIFLWPWLQSIGLGSLPGDFMLEFAGSQIPLPLTSTLIISVGVLILLNLISGGSKS